MNPSAVTAAANALVAKAAEVVGASQRFSIEKSTYREGYDKLYTLYVRVKTTRETLEQQAGSIDPTSASLEIDGIREGARLARDAVGGVRQGSLRDALFVVENQLAKLLNEMHDSYVSYTRTDQEAAFDLIGTARTQ